MEKRENTQGLEGIQQRWSNKGPDEIMWNANLMQRGNFIDVFLALTCFGRIRLSSEALDVELQHMVFCTECVPETYRAKNTSIKLPSYYETLPIGVLLWTQQTFRFHKMRGIFFLTSSGTIRFHVEWLCSMEKLFYLSQCYFYAPLLHLLRFPFSAFIALRFLYLFHCSLLTMLLHSFHVLTLYYDPDTTFNLCNSSVQLQYEPKLLLQPHSLTHLVNLTSGYVYEPIKIPVQKVMQYDSFYSPPDSANSLTACRILHFWILPYIFFTLTNNLPIYLTTDLTVLVTEHRETT